MPGRLARDGVYTPQVVVNGRVEGDGLEPGALAGLMSRGDRGAGGPNVGFAGGAVTVGAGAAPAGGADVWLARYIPRTVEVAIPRGENAGHTLPYKDVVREMVLLGHWRGEAATFPLPGGSDAGPRRGGDRAGRGLRAGIWRPPGAERARERADQPLSFKLARDPAPGLPGNFTAKCSRHALTAWTFAHQLRHNSCVRTGRFLPPNREIKSRTGIEQRARRALATIGSNCRKGP